MTSPPLTPTTHSSSSLFLLLSPRRRLPLRIPSSLTTLRCLVTPAQRLGNVLTIIKITSIYYDFAVVQESFYSTSKFYNVYSTRFSPPIESSFDQKCTRREATFAILESNSIKVNLKSKSNSQANLIGKC